MAWMRWCAVVVLGVMVAGCSAPSELGGGDRALVAGRTYVVTGASSGFGRGVAEKLGTYGANVVLAARRGAVLEEVAAQVRASGGQALVVPTDAGRLFFDRAQMLLRLAGSISSHAERALKVRMTSSSAIPARLQSAPAVVGALSSAAMRRICRPKAAGSAGRSTPRSGQ